MDTMQTIHLSDGRKLAYAEYGPSEGKPVIACHGLPGSRLEQPGDMATLLEQNVRLIVVDRPGYGLSDFQDDRKILDWPDDVIQLADLLQLGCFAVMGYSAGGAYAAACAFKLPERVTAATLVSSVAPYNAPPLTDAMMPANCELFELAANNRPQAEKQLATVAGTPEAMLGLMDASLPDTDKTVLSDQAFRQMYLANLTEAYRQGLSGITHDMALIAKPWGFDLAAIEAKVQLWHGEQDVSVPVGMGQYLASTFPHCQARFIPNTGHLLMFEQWKPVLRALTSTGES